MERCVREKKSFKEYYKVQNTDSVIIDKLLAKICLYTAKNISAEEKFNDERVK